MSNFLKDFTSGNFTSEGWNLLRIIVDALIFLKLEEASQMLWGTVRIVSILQSFGDRLWPIPLVFPLNFFSFSFYSLPTSISLLHHSCGTHCQLGHSCFFQFLPALHANCSLSLSWSLLAPPCLFGGVLINYSTLFFIDCLTLLLYFLLFSALLSLTLSLFIMSFLCFSFSTTSFPHVIFLFFLTFCYSFLISTFA